MFLYFEQCKEKNPVNLIFIFLKNNSEIQNMFFFYFGQLKQKKTKKSVFKKILN